MFIAVVVLSEKHEDTLSGSASSSAKSAVFKTRDEAEDWAIAQKTEFESQQHAYWTYQAEMAIRPLEIGKEIETEGTWFGFIW